MLTAERERGTQNKCGAADAAVALESIVVLICLHDCAHVICEGVSVLLQA